ncbi:hypothetical protein [Zavarzinia sp. CC-PAN008]|uniref:hypothetical protein n=1 Tax=Zavarzinia sp. CC-PAN008 TaxID=3243332 RepID=UPI003F7487BB
MAGADALLRALATPLPLKPPANLWWMWLFMVVFGLVLGGLTTFLVASDLIGATQGQVLRDTAVRLGLGELEARRPETAATCSQEAPGDHVCLLDLRYTNAYGNADSWTAVLRSPVALPPRPELDLYRVQVDRNLPGLDLASPTLGQRWALHLGRVEWQWLVILLFILWTPALLGWGQWQRRRRRAILEDAAGPTGRPVLVELKRRRYRPAFRFQNAHIPEKIVWHYEWRDRMGMRRRVRERVQKDPLRLGPDGMTGVALATRTGDTVLVEHDLGQFTLSPDRQHAVWQAMGIAPPGTR